MVHFKDQEKYQPSEVKHRIRRCTTRGALADFKIFEDFNKHQEWTEDVPYYSTKTLTMIEVYRLEGRASLLESYQDFLETSTTLKGRTEDVLYHSAKTLAMVEAYDAQADFEIFGNVNKYLGVDQGRAISFCQDFGDD
ncbi:hypothetical protein PVK06_019150 [Gossypium arboreum]|uniref:Uncharacterized protein n=1 Tax=Gossypium arboreum TaxID=29729 RepID=A0ABR0PJC9_GOSAR|nr:hypothetical protein PVK06_019150 [Gossypium arboreum]